MKHRISILAIQILSIVCGFKAPKGRPVSPCRNKFWGILINLSCSGLGLFVGHQLKSLMDQYPGQKKNLHRVGYIADAIMTLHSAKKCGDWTFEGNAILRYIGTEYGDKLAITALVVLSEISLHTIQKDSLQDKVLPYARSMAVFSHLPFLFTSFLQQDLAGNFVPSTEKGACI